MRAGPVEKAENTHYFNTSSKKLRYIFLEQADMYASAKALYNIGVNET